MYFNMSSLVLLLYWVTLPVQGLDGASQKDSSKISSFKAKLSRTDLSTKSSVSESTKLDEKVQEIHSAVELGISVPPEHANDTFEQGHHVYYNSTFYSDPEKAKRLWIDLDSLNQEVITNEKLSNSHRQAMTVELPFDFPFYGSILRNVTIATGGFLYMGDYLHNWIAATQYVAPLMANFDTSISTESVIKYAKNGTAFIVQWEKVFVQDRLQDGAFTFQVTLLKSGDIVFAYKDVPYPVTSISDSVHPVKIGISDAYILERTIYFIRRKTVYEYHRIQITWNISNNTALYFTALPTCLGYKNCSSCLSADATLDCSWCAVVERCSDGIDRLRQDWVMHGCTIKKETTCDGVSMESSTNKAPSSTYPSKGVEISTKKLASKSTSKYASSTYNVENTSSANYGLDRNRGEMDHLIQEEAKTVGPNISPGAIVTIVLFLAAVVSAIAWVVYAYKFPQTPSGQFFIKYRPSQWTLKKEESAVTTRSQNF